MPQKNAALAGFFSLHPNVFCVFLHLLLCLSIFPFSIRKRGRVIPSNQHINHNRQQIKHRHPRKHRLIPKRGNQSPCNRAANADADIIRAEEGGICTAALFGWCNRHRHGLQCRLQSAEAKAGKHCRQKIRHCIRE